MSDDTRTDNYPGQDHDIDDNVDDDDDDDDVGEILFPFGAQRSEATAPVC